MAPETNGIKKPSFLFTSESVGEGHPDKIAYVLSGLDYQYSSAEYNVATKYQMPSWTPA